MSDIKDILAAEEDKKKKEESEAEKQQHEEELQHNVDEMAKSMEKEKLKREIDSLKDLVEQGELGDIENSYIEKIQSSEQFDEAEILDIFEKINEIEDIDGVEKILPQELRITKREYLDALKDDDARVAAINKLNNALDYLYQQSQGNDMLGMNMIFGLFYVLDENLKLAQENMIDIKDNLESKNETEEQGSMPWYKRFYKALLQFFGKSH